MTSRNKWVIIKPIRRISHAALTSDCSARRALSTKSEGTRALTVPKLSHRLRRLAKAYPDAIGAVSSTAVEDSRIAGVMNANDEEATSSVDLAQGTSTALIMANVYVGHAGESTTETNEQLIRANAAPRKKWTKSQISSPEFFHWLNTYHKHGPALENEQAKDEDEEQKDPINIGKEFLNLRVKTLSFDGGIFGVHLLESRDEVLSARTSAQLKMACEQLRFLEAAVQERASGYKSVEIGWNKPTPAARPVVNVTTGISKTSRGRPGGGAAGTATRVIYGPSETFAYVSHRMMPAYSVLHRLIMELKNELVGFNPRTMLDFGSGPGTAALAAWHVWGSGGRYGDQDWEEGSQLSEIRLVEESQSMMDASKIMLRPLIDSGRMRVGYGTSLLEEAKAAIRDKKKQDELTLHEVLTMRVPRFEPYVFLNAGTSSGQKEHGEGGKKFDLVVAAYAISHLPTHAARAAATAVMWNLVAPGGVLLVVEDGSAKGSHTVRSARQLVLSSAASSSATRSKVSSGAAGNSRGTSAPVQATEDGQRSSRPSPYVVAPCQHDGACPMRAERGELCRFTHKVPTGGINAAKSLVRSSAFSYVSIRKGVPDPVELKGEGTESRTSSSSVELLKTFAQLGKQNRTLSAAMESLGTDGICDNTIKRHEWGRLVRKPLKGQGHVLLDMCTPDGEIQRKAVSRSAWKGAPGVFVSARKCQLGGLWPYLDRQSVKSEAFATQVQVEDEVQDIALNEGDWGSSDDDSDGEGEWVEDTDIDFHNFESGTKTELKRHILGQSENLEGKRSSGIGDRGGRRSAGMERKDRSQRVRAGRHQ